MKVFTYGGGEFEEENSLGEESRSRVTSFVECRGSL